MGINKKKSLYRDRKVTNINYAKKENNKNVHSF